MEEEESLSGHTRRERKDEFLVLFSVNNGMIILIIICVLKLKSRSLVPLFAFVLGRPGTGRILFPYTFPEIWQGRLGNFFRKCYK